MHADPANSAAPWDFLAVTLTPALSAFERLGGPAYLWVETGLAVPLRRYEITNVFAQAWVAWRLSLGLELRFL